MLMGLNKITFQPTLTDLNKESGDAIAAIYAQNGWHTDISTAYDDPNYIPLWNFRTESRILEDLQGNGVFYIFDWDNGDPSGEDLLSLEQTSSVYELELDNNPSMSWEDEEWYWFDWGLTTALFTLNSRDDASQAPLAGSDNYNVAIDGELVIIDAAMFPLKPRWTENGVYTSPQKIFLNGQYYNWCSIDVPAVRNNEEPNPSSGFNPSSDPLLEYKVEWNDGGTWTVLYDYGDAQPVPPVDAPDSMVGPNSYWILSDVGTFTEYRMRIRNYLGEEGMYSSEFYTI
jgi:hypothetical protein